MRRSGIFETGCSGREKSNGSNQMEMAMIRELNETCPSSKALIASNPQILALASKETIHFFQNTGLLSESEKIAKLPLLFKITMSFPIQTLLFNHYAPQYLCVVGLKDAVILTLDVHKKSLKSRLPVDLMLASYGDQYNIHKVQWIPNSQVMLAVAAFNFVKVFNLNLDNIAPIYNFILFESMVRDVHFVLDDQSFTLSEDKSQHANVRMFVGTSNGYVFTHLIDPTGVVSAEHELQPMSDVEDNSLILTEAISMPEGRGEIPKGEVMGVFFSKNCELLFISYKNGQTVYGKLDPLRLRFLSLIQIRLMEQSPQTNVLNTSFYYSFGDYYANSNL